MTSFKISIRSNVNRLISIPLFNIVSNISRTIVKSFESNFLIKSNLFSTDNKP